jgi:hypothetical protein
MPSLILGIHPCVLDLMIIPLREWPQLEQIDREAVACSTAAR